MTKTYAEFRIAAHKAASTMIGALPEETDDSVVLQAAMDIITFLLHTTSPSEELAKVTLKKVTKSLPMLLDEAYAASRSGTKH